MAIDNYGESYYSLTQVNTNEDVFSIFLERLAGRLNLQRPGWRQDTILLLDNASYHTSECARDTLARLKFPVCYSAAYSFETAPVELYFSLFKRHNMFSDKEPTGKK